MKARAQPAFWPLRPIPTARGFELACWLAAAILALALTLAPVSGRRAAAQAITVTVPPPAPHLVLYQQHCIERILAHAAGKTEEDVAGQINLQCRGAGGSQPSSTAGSTPLSCERPFTVRLAPVTKRVTGCLGG
jgi:hypothetical protein